MDFNNSFYQLDLFYFFIPLFSKVVFKILGGLSLKFWEVFSWNFGRYFIGFAGGNRIFCIFTG